MADQAAAVQAPVTIKKYANRRLYNTASSSYVTLDDLCRMVQQGTDFIVYDAKTGDDLTRAVLTQIIVEEEQKGTNLLPISFLRQLIGCYGDNMQWLVPRYLDHMMMAFKRHQDQLKLQLQSSFGGIFPFASIEEVGKHNMALFEQAMQLLNPFVPPVVPGEAGAAAPVTPAPEATSGASLDQVRRQLAEMQAQVDALVRLQAKQGDDSNEN
jgi:polyhydroxyalkanoate synthesis repressor PhaR